MLRMSLEKRYKVYLILAVLLCAVGVGLNIFFGNKTGLGSLIITVGGITLVLGITIKRKSNDTKDPSDNELSSQ